MKITTKTLNIISHSAVILFSIVFSIKFIALSTNGIINGYPFISPDGFDWYGEGAYLFSSFYQNINFPLQVLRPPIFVLICAFDYMMGGKGYILGVVYGLNILIFYIYMCKLVTLIYAKDSLFISYPLIVLSCTVLPINFIRPYILADEIAITLLIASTFYLIKGIKISIKYYGIGALISIVGGLTQTYAMLPLLCIFFMYLIESLINKNKINKSILTYTIISVVGYIIFLYAWRISIPHVSTPNNFNLLSIDLKMLGFYANSWSIYLLPLIIFKIISNNLNIKKELIFENKGLILTVILFITLSFFYHWPESRFIAYYWPVVLILFLVLVEINKIQLFYLSFIFIFCSLIAPANYWTPTWGAVNYGHNKTWYYNFFNAKPDEREFNNCKNVECINLNKYFINSDQYVKSSLEIYIKLKNLDK